MNPPAEPVDAPMQIAAIEAAANPMFMADRGGRIRWINQAFSRLYGYDLAEVEGKTPRVLKSGRQTDEFYKALWQTIAGGEVWRGQLANRKKNGELIDVEQTITPVRDGEGRISHYLAIYEDITHRLRSEQSIARLALFDSLTGLPNRNNFQRRVAEALARSKRNDRLVGVMLLDLDHFKQVNDTLGHAAGDDLLAQAAGRMRPCLRDADTVARLSGDEFAILVENLNRPEQAVESAQRLLQAVQEPYEIQGHAVRVGASIGIALSGAADATPEDLLHQADLAMYQAKASGRGQFQFFDAAMDAAARRRHATESALRMALREDTLQIVYQPQVRLDTGEIVGAEALLRWTDPARGAIPPGEFVALAEQTGLIFALNDWVLLRVLRDISGWRRDGSSLVPVAANLSAGHFDKVGLAATLERLLTQHDVPPSALRIEITETAMLRPSTIVHENLRALVRLGIGLGVDDFGTGYSSLPALREFPIDYVKLDRSFVRAIGVSRRDEDMLRAIICLTRTLGLHVIAEGVETLQHRDFLLAEKCLHAQGFLYSPGVPADKFLALLATGRIEPSGHIHHGGVQHTLRFQADRPP